MNVSILMRLKVVYRSSGDSLGIGGYLAIKWHFDEEARVREEKGVAFDRSSYMKKMVMILAFLVTVVVLVIYATNWYLD
ncbi:hypothetical protein KW542_09120 [Vibrio fluvialis]|nr:hypothetical protein [Vibrio fluvialis]